MNFDESGNPIRGVRTLGEIAHFVRCLPYHQRDNFGQQLVWCSPDFILKSKIGNELDHALLMASLFRTSKYEDHKEYLKWVVQQKKDRKNKKLEQMEKVERPKKDEGDLMETRENILKSDNKWDISNFLVKDEEGAKDSINDRVFVCYGMSSDGYERKVWVMTLNRSYDEVTFWDVK